MHCNKKKKKREREKREEKKKERGRKEKRRRGGGGGGGALRCRRLCCPRGVSFDGPAKGEKFRNAKFVKKKPKKKGQKKKKNIAFTIQADARRQQYMSCTG